VNYGSGISRVRLIRVRLVLVNLNSSYIFCSFFITKLLHTKLRPKMTGGRVFQKSQKISIIWAGTSLSRPTLEPKIRTPSRARTHIKQHSGRDWPIFYLSANLPPGDRKSVSDFSSTFYDNNDGSSCWVFQSINSTSIRYSLQHAGS